MVRMSHFNAALLTIAILLFTACRPRPEQMKRVLQDHPEYIFEVLENHPDKLSDLMKQYGAATVGTGGAPKKEAAIVVEKEPFRPVISKDRPVRGNLNAPIILVEYSDFQCPYCSLGYMLVEKLREKYGSRLAFTYKHFPLPSHKWAMAAARRFEAVALQNKEKALEFHDLVFENQSRINTEGEKVLDELLASLRIDTDKARRDLISPIVESRIHEDMAEGRRFGVNGTPSFVLNGKLISGAAAVEVFDKIIQERGISSRK